MKTGKRLLLAGLLGLAIGGEASALAVYGLTTANSLVLFDSAAPGTVNSSVNISGLNTGASLRGIDFRPVDGQLYGVSSDNRIYTINTTSGVASVIGAAGAFSLSGTSFGFDFNPTVDRIRVTSDADQNLRLNPITGGLAATDGNLAYVGTNVGANPNIVGSAYTNSFLGATTTTLFDIDSALDVLVTQAPPNAGTLNTVGALGFNTSDQVGFDIFFFGNQAFASLTTPGAGSSLFSINLATGAASNIGAIGNSLVISDIAIQQVPEPGTLTLMAAALIGAVAVRRRRKAP
jgi:hypothetical protein